MTSKVDRAWLILYLFKCVLSDYQAWLLVDSSDVLNIEKATPVHWEDET